MQKSYERRVATVVQKSPEENFKRTENIKKRKISQTKEFNGKQERDNQIKIQNDQEKGEKVNHFAKKHLSDKSETQQPASLSSSRYLSSAKQYFSPLRHFSSHDRIEEVREQMKEDEVK